MSGKSIAWIVAACGIAAVGAVVALLATGFFEATEPVDSPFTLQDAEVGDVDDAAPGAAPSSPAPRRGPPPEIALAERLLDDIPSGAKVALQPLDQRYAGLEPAVGDPLYERLLLALTNAAEDGVTLLARERLRAIYNSLEEFYQGDIESLLRNAQADIEIICKPTSNATGIILSCSAVRLVNAVTLATAAAHFPITRRAAHFDVAIDAIASRLAQGAPPGTVTLVPLLDTGVETTLTRRIGERLEDKIATAMAKRLGSRAAEAAANAALGDGQASGSDVPRYRLRGELPLGRPALPRGRPATAGGAQADRGWGGCGHRLGTSGVGGQPEQGRWCAGADEAVRSGGGGGCLGALGCSVGATSGPELGSRPGDRAGVGAGRSGGGRGAD